MVGLSIKFYSLDRNFMVVLFLKYMLQSRVQHKNSVFGAWLYFKSHLRKTGSGVKGLWQIQQGKTIGFCTLKRTPKISEKTVIFVSPSHGHFSLHETSRSHSTHRNDVMRNAIVRCAHFDKDVRATGEVVHVQ